MNNTELLKNFRGGVLHKSDASQMFPLQSGLKIDVAGLMIEDYFDGENNIDSERSRESYKRAEECAEKCGITRRDLANLMDKIEDYAGDKEAQGFLAGLRYGFSVWESLKR